jgi:hypothetical protein
MASHSCSRCSWLVLRSDPAVNQRIVQEEEIRHRRYGNSNWYFVWPIVYNASDGECELLESLFKCILDRDASTMQEFSNVYALEGNLTQASFTPLPMRPQLQLKAIAKPLVLEKLSGSLFTYTGTEMCFEPFTKSGKLNVYV